MANCYCTRSSVDLCDHCTETFSQGWDSGKAQERERIIALLTARAEKDDREAYPFVGSAFRSAIALIKGENE